MSVNTLLILIGWLFALAIFFGFIVLLRYLHHRERMALIVKGINPDDLHDDSIRGRPRRKNPGLLRAGLIIAMVGLSLTIGLYPIGFLLPHTIATAPLHLGPWLLPGLIPLGVGTALVGSYYLEPNVQQPAQPPNDDHIKKNVTHMVERLDKKRLG